MLYFVDAELALGYVLFSFLSALGIVQIAAARYDLSGLAVFDYSKRRARGYALGILLVVASTAVFFGSQWMLVLTPGPAGSELAFLFAGSAACAIGVSLVVAAARHRAQSHTTAASDEDGGEAVAAGSATGRLYVPATPTSPMPAVCLVPGPDPQCHQAMVELARQFVRSQIVALLITPKPGLYTYPEALAVLPAAAGLLRKRPDVDPQRIGALGYDLGGDLVIRAASGDKQLSVVAALAPVLQEPKIGMDLLREMAFPEAWRWARDRERDRLRSSLNALEYAQRIVPRPLLLLYGAEDRLASSRITAEETQEASLPPSLLQDSTTLLILPDIGHLDLMDHSSTRQAVELWFREHL